MIHRQQLPGVFDVAVVSEVHISGRVCRLLSGQSGRHVVKVNSYSLMDVMVRVESNLGTGPVIFDGPGST